MYKDPSKPEPTITELLLKGMQELTESIESEDISDYKLTVLNQKTGNRVDFS